jgi:large subunit ribosomal protein L2
MNKKIGIGGVVKSIEYDPNRTAFIALIAYEDGEKKYIIAAEGLKEGDKIITNEKAPVKPGNRMQLQHIPPGFSIHNFEVQPGRGGQIVRSAGSSAKLITIEGKYAQIELPSSEIRIVPKECYASIGVVSNSDHSLARLGKAGRKRWLGVRPTVKGKNMNPCDHPHGGGEGHSPIGMKHPKTPWGLPALGVKTRRKKQSDKFIIKNRKRRK